MLASPGNTFWALLRLKHPDLRIAVAAEVHKEIRVLGLSTVIRKVQRLLGAGVEIDGAAPLLGS